MVPRMDALLWKTSYSCIVVVCSLTNRLQPERGRPRRRRPAPELCFSQHMDCCEPRIEEKEWRHCARLRTHLKLHNSKVRRAYCLGGKTAGPALPRLHPWRVAFQYCHRVLVPSTDLLTGPVPCLMLRKDGVLQGRARTADLIIGRRCPRSSRGSLGRPKSVHQIRGVRRRNAHAGGGAKMRLARVGRVLGRDGERFIDSSSSNSG